MSYATGLGQNIEQNHVSITVSGTTYKLLVNPYTYTKVDIVDFAPRAVAGTPRYSELGLYLQVAQDGFRHGFGVRDFGEPMSYWWSSGDVTTLNDRAQVATQMHTIDAGTADDFGCQAVFHHRYNTLLVREKNIDAIIANGDTTGDISRDIMGSDDAGVFYHGLSNGRYFFIAKSGNMYAADIGVVTSATSNSLTVLVDPEWDPNTFGTGTVRIWAGGAAVGVTGTVDSNGSNNLVITGTWSTTPSSGDKFIVWVNCGVAGNPPNNFYRLAMFGGYMWGAETNYPYLHFWAELDGADAEGGQTADTAAVRVGPGDILINNMVAFQNQLWVFREDGAWAVGDDNLAYHMLDFTEEIHRQNFSGVAVWNGFLWFTVRHKIYKYRSGLQDVTPPVLDDLSPPQGWGWFRGLVPRGKHLYAVASSNTSMAGYGSEDSGTFTSLLASDGIGWHKIGTLSTGSLYIAADTTIRSGLWLDPVNDRLLYGGPFDDTNSPIISYRFQAYTDLPYADYDTGTTNYLYTSFFDLGHRRIDKAWVSVAADGYFPSSTSIQVSYRTSEGGAWTIVPTDLTAPLTDVNLKSTGVVEGKIIQFRLKMVGTATTSPQLKTLIIKAMMRPQTLYGVSFETPVQDGLSGPDHFNIPHSSDEIRTGLEAARSSVAPITFTDVFGNSADAYLSSLRYTLDELEEGGVRETAKVTIVYV